MQEVHSEITPGVIKPLCDFENEKYVLYTLVGLLSKDSVNVI